MQAVIMAGGKGTRLFELTNDEIPKSMVQVSGKPILQWQIECLQSNGITDIRIVIGHLGEKITSFFGDGADLGVSLTYFREEIPLGTAGALAHLQQFIAGDYFLLIYGDVIFNIDIFRMAAFHKKKNAFASLFVHPNSHPFDSDLVSMDSDGRITGFDSKSNVRTYWYDNMVNAGFYILSKELCRTVPLNRKTDLEKDILFKNCKPRPGIFGYASPEYIKDAGTVDRIQHVEYDIRNGTVAAKNLSKPQKCIFLDRDGVLNRHVGLLYEPEQLELEETVPEALSMLNSSRYLAIVITNQPVVARGLCEIETIYEIHRKLQTQLGDKYAYLDDILFCPHHPDKGFPEENPEYKVKCECRKPNIGLIMAAAAKYNIDLSNSWIIGDTTVDVMTGKNANMRTILVKTGEAGLDGKYDVKPDYVADNLADAVKIILVSNSL